MFEVLREDGTPFPLRRAARPPGPAGQALDRHRRFRSKRTGEERWSFVSGAPVLDANGNVEPAVSVFREFTDRRRTEQSWQFLAERAPRSVVARLPRHAEAGGRPGGADASPTGAASTSWGPTDRLEQLAVAHVDPAKRELAKEWRRRWPPRPSRAVISVVRTGLSRVISEITDAMIDAGTPDPEQRRMAMALGLRSAMVVPLIVGRSRSARLVHHRGVRAAATGRTT